MLVIGICGQIGSGKDTVADYLVREKGYVKIAFADTLKDAVSAIFGWDRDMISGITPESREWREKVDEWWSKRLGIPHLTPRWVLQNFGTDVCRQHFHQDIWLASLEKRLSTINAPGAVVSDCRFANELEWVANCGWPYRRISLSRGVAKAASHVSEQILTGDFHINNDGTLEELYAAVDGLL